MDEFTKSMFTSMGLDGENLSDVIINTFTEFKAKKDLLQPGRLSAEGYATVLMIAELRTVKKRQRKPSVKKKDAKPVAETAAAPASELVPEGSEQAGEKPPWKDN